VAMRRVHFSEPHDVLIMRPGPWGNPFSSKPYTLAKFSVNCRAQALRYFQDWVVSQPSLVEKAKQELTGKILACGCQATELCHGDIWLAVIYDLPLPLKDVHPDPIEPTLF